MSTRTPQVPSTSSRSRSRYGKEVQELKDALNNPKLEIKRDAIRKIIDAMTRGKDVSMLFTDIAKNMETNNLELKKLVYLYIINYAKILPDLAIMAINSFRKDARDRTNPFLRSLAIRTMGCIRVKQITEYLIDPLKESLKDEDSYVRKTAAICIAKLYEVFPELIEEQGFLKLLDNLLNDGNAMVVANTVCALLMVSEMKGQNILILNAYTVQKILTAMNDCNEWGVIYTLDALALYTPEDSKEAEAIIERVCPRLAHQNPGVVLSACKIMMRYLDFLTSPEVINTYYIIYYYYQSIRQYAKKMTSPLISLLTGKEPEIEYVALKNINIIIQKRPIIIEKEIKVFFCNFNDPIYIKLQKLDILAKLANMDTIQIILHELKEYTSEVDVEFVRKAVSTIGRCAIKLDRAAEKCVQALWECLRTKVNYVVQESIIVIRDIFRKYPRKYEMILKDLCDNLKSLDDPDARASIIWIIGEYVETIENADELLANFSENFKEEAPVVQHQTLTAAIKLFLLRPNDGHELVQNLLKIATTECENPDLRDRAYIYWRLLHTDPELTKKIVFAERPVISEQSYTIETQLLDKLVENIGTLASVYTKAPEQFVKKLRDVLNQQVQDKAEDEFYGEELMENNLGRTSEQFDQSGQPTEASMTSSQIQPQVQQSKVDNLLDMDDTPVQNQNEQSQPALNGSQRTNNGQQPTQNVQAPIQNFSSPSTQQLDPQQFKQIKIPLTEILNATQNGQGGANGLQIEGAFQKQNDNFVLLLRFNNRSSDKIFTDFAMKFNNNAFKIQPNQIEVAIAPVAPQSTQTYVVQLNCNGPASNDPPSFPYKVQVALKTNLDVFYFFIPCSLSVLFSNRGLITPQEYQQIAMNQALPRKQEVIQTQLDTQSIKQKLADNFVYLVGIRKNEQGIELMSYSVRLQNDMVLLVDAILSPSGGALNLQLIAPHPSLLALFYQALGFILTM